MTQFILYKLFVIQWRVFRYRHFHTLIRNYMHTRTRRNKCYVVNPPVRHFIGDSRRRAGGKSCGAIQSASVGRLKCRLRRVEVPYCYYVTNTIQHIVFPPIFYMTYLVSDKTIDRCEVWRIVLSLNIEWKCCFFVWEHARRNIMCTKHTYIIYDCFFFFL